LVSLPCAMSKLFERLVLLLHDLVAERITRNPLGPQTNPVRGWSATRNQSDRQWNQISATTTGLGFRFLRARSHAPISGVNARRKFLLGRDLLKELAEFFTFGSG
jgi:hypothetical protein